MLNLRFKASRLTGAFLFQLDPGPAFEPMPMLHHFGVKANDSWRYFVSFQAEQLKGTFYPIRFILYNFLLPNKVFSMKAQKTFISDEGNAL